MALSKNPKYDLKRIYVRILQISFIISLSLLILAFKFFPDIEISIFESDPPPVEITVLDVPITNVDTKPPPPKQINIYEELTDELMDDYEIDPTDLFEDDVIAKVGPPITNDEVIPVVIFVVVEEMPEPIGGIGAIQKLITYPELAKRAGVQGKVQVRAFVDEKGYVFKVELLRGIGGGCDEVAMDAVKKTLFTPGKQRGRAVKVMVTVPVKFTLR